VASALLDRYAGVTPVSVVLPFAAHWNPLFVGLGTVSLDLLAAVVVSSLLRRHLALGTWRGVHFLAYASWPVAVAHSIGAGTDAGTTWLRVLVAACVATVSVAAAWRVSRRNGGRRQLEPREVTG
jgi:sulfoxide reductase heme-binding subunit YedZ